MIRAEEGPRVDEETSATAPATRRDDFWGCHLGLQLPQAHQRHIQVSLAYTGRLGLRPWGPPPDRTPCVVP